MGRSQCLGHGGMRTETDRTVDLVEVDRSHAQALHGGLQRLHEGSADVDLPGEGHELGGDDHLVRPPGVLGPQGPYDALALALPVDFGGVEEGDAGIDGGVPGVANRVPGQFGVVATHPPGGAVAPRPGSHPQRRDGDVRTAQDIPVRDHRCTVAAVSIRPTPQARPR